MTYREHKTAARLAIHKEFAVPAIYIAPGGAQTACEVRVHNYNSLQGAIRRADAEVIEMTPTAIFLVSQVQPTRNGIISVAPGEAYRLGEVQPPDGITVSAAIAAMKLPDTDGLPVPV